MADERRLKLTPPEFRGLFSVFEEAGIRRFAQGKDANAPIVAIWLDRLSDPHLTEVDLGKPEHRQGLAYLSGLGLISPARADVIAQGLPADPPPPAIIEA